MKCKDPKGVLKQLASFGYKQMESYEGGKGMFWGMTNVEFKKYVEGLGMTIVASHCDMYKDFEKKANDAAAIGMKYLLYPSADLQKTADDYKKIADRFNQCGEICKKAGIRFGYHSHDHDYRMVEGQMAQDIYMQNADPALMDFELDIYWAVTANQDPEVWLKKYPNRFRLCHIKDRVKGATQREAMCILGKGSIDFPKILKTAKANGMKYYFAEQDECETGSPVECMKANAEYMKRLRI